MLGLFAHPVACCCVLLGVVAQKLKPVKLLAMCKRMQQPTRLLGQQSLELLRPFTRNLACVAFVPISFAPLHPIPSRFSCPSPTWLKADTHGGFCSRSVLQAHFARVSTYEGALSSSLNLPWEFAPKYLTG